ERMLMVLKPGREEMARAIFDKWELDLAVIGETNDSQRLVLMWQDDVVADIPVPPLVDAAPEYERPWTATPPRAVLSPDDVVAPDNLAEALLQLVASPDLCSRRWVWEQYDHMVMGDTVGRPGGDAALVRVHGTDKALAISTDCTPRYVVANPIEGGKQAVAESWRNVTAVGATPLAVTNNLNFGNPERPEIMGQLVGAVQGMGAACEALDAPVVSGNVSLYNETNGEAILPTPVIGCVGLIDDLTKAVGGAFANDGDTVFVVGETAGWLGCSIYQRDQAGGTAGAPPPVDLNTERRNGDFVRAVIHSGKINACHDVSDGGIAVALAEMAIAGDIGAEISHGSDLPTHAWAFGEDQARYIVTCTDAAEFAVAAKDAKVHVERIGTVGGAALTLPEAKPISVAALRDAHLRWLPTYMASRES
ncbi:MAG: phosphoribosylformylglycinamidine synthase II, partial [Rhodospirillaceae bacterium]|nr:phosphoribosylformylglycinamidine synthase II [Rhodospirillaceae bacterium]